MALIKEKKKQEKEKGKSSRQPAYGTTKRKEKRKQINKCHRTVDEKSPAILICHTKLLKNV